MKTSLRTLVLSALVIAILPMAVAQKTKTKADPAAKPKCPVCGMFLASKPTKASTVAVRLKKGGPVLYCCNKCKMPGSVLVKSKTATKKPSK